MPTLFQQFLTSALLAATGAAGAATCTTTDTAFGSVGDTPGHLFANRCSAAGLDPADPDRWTFEHRIHFSLATAADVWGHIDLNFTRAYQVDPTAPWLGEPYYVVRTDPILLLHGGVTRTVGGEGAGHDESASFFAHGLGAGDYTLVLQGRVFDTGARLGFYDGYLAVRSLGVAPPVPEPAALALLGLGLPLVAAAARRRAPRRAAAEAHPV